VKKLQITVTELEGFRDLQGKHRSDCIAAFTATPNGPMSPYRKNSKTPEDWRCIDASVASAALDEIGKAFLALPEKPTGGRFFID
jgi:hypothetical protein